MVEKPTVNAPYIGYDAFKRKDTMACITLLSAMVDDLMMKFSMLERDKAKEKYGPVSLEKQRALILRFENYMKKLKNNKSTHLREMSRMIVCLKAFKHTFTYEQQV